MTRGLLTRRSNRRSLWLAGLALVGCSAVYGIDPPGPVEDESGGGAGGETPQEPTVPASGAGGEPSRDAGGDGGSAGEAPPSGGAGPSAGDGGEGGDGRAAPEWPLVGDPCSRPGALTCLGRVTDRTAFCQGGFWVPGPVCGEKELCDVRTGSCAGPACEFGTDSFCSLNFAVSCGPGLTLRSIETCVFGCNQATAHCNEPSADDLVMDRPPPISTARAYWPNALIPVCVEDATRREWAVIRDEVDRTWGRYSAVAFTGWDECAESFTGVELRLADGCDGELGGVDRFGYPGPNGKLAARLCSSYFDARHPAGSSEPVTTEPDLLRLIARHQFGHVLGFDDVPFDVARNDFMMAAVRLSTYRDLEFGASAITALSVYGPKPAHSLVTTGGSCLSLEAGELSEAACDGGAARSWQLHDARLRHLASETCLAATEAGSIESRDCSPEADPDAAAALSFQPLRVQLRDYAGKCVSVREDLGADPEVLLAIEPCAPADAERQTWRFEFSEDGDVRIVHATSGRCVTVPESLTPPAWPGLSTACDAANARLGASNGRLHSRGHCLQSRIHRHPLVGVGFTRCGTTQRDLFWALSGPLQNAQGLALTRSNDTVPAFRAAPLATPASLDQVFDYHF